MAILPPTEQQANISWQIMTRVDTVSLGEPFGIAARLSINLDNSLTGPGFFMVAYAPHGSRITGHSRLIFPCSSFSAPPQP